MTNDLELYRKIMRVSHLLRHGGGEPALKVAPGQQRVLAALAEKGDMTQRNLVEELGIAPASMSELLSKLEAKELIARVKSESDRRVAHVALTEEGRRNATALLDAQRKVANSVFSALDGESRTQLADLLDRIAAE